MHGSRGNNLAHTEGEGRGDAPASEGADGFPDAGDGCRGGFGEGLGLEAGFRASWCLRGCGCGGFEGGSGWGCGGLRGGSGCGEGLRVGERLVGGGGRVRVECVSRGLCRVGRVWLLVVVFDGLRGGRLGVRRDRRHRGGEGPREQGSAGATGAGGDEGDLDSATEHGESRVGVWGSSGRREPSRLPPPPRLVPLLSREPRVLSL